MSDCCHTECKASLPAKRRCPRSGSESLSVPLKTVLHHVKQPWRLAGKTENYYFCEDADCDVVYFGEDDSLIKTTELRTVVGIKTQDRDALLCYCFGVSRAALAEEPMLRDYVVQQTKAGLCSCETHNPSGRCCLKDFPRSAQP